MPKTPRVVERQSLSELDALIKQSKSPLEVRRLLVVRYAQARPSGAKEMSQHTGFSPGRVKNLISRYHKAGPSSPLRKRRLTQARANLSHEEEKNFITIL